MGIVAQDFFDLAYYQKVLIAIQYVNQTLDKNHTGSFSTKQELKDPLLGHYIASYFNNDSDRIDINKEFKTSFERASGEDFWSNRC